MTAQRLYRAEYRTRHAPNNDSIRKWIRIFENTGATVKIQNSGRPRSVRDKETIEEVEASVRQNPSLSIRKRSQALNIIKSPLHSILKKYLHLKAYKIQLVQELKDTNYANRLNTAAKKKKEAKRPAAPIAPVASGPVPTVPVAGPSSLEPMEIRLPLQEDPMLPSTTAANEWTQVKREGKKKKAPQQSSSSAAHKGPANKAAPVPASKSGRKKKSATKTAAVVVTISQEAAAAGETYESVFLRAR